MAHAATDGLNVLQDDADGAVHLEPPELEADLNWVHADSLCRRRQLSVQRRHGKKVRPEHWKLEPNEQDYPAALSYLSLMLPSATAEEVVSRLGSAEVQHFKAQDLLRASRLELLPKDNFHVAADLRKVKRGQPLSPVLLVRGQMAQGVALAIADGYHRVCASYAIDENADIACRLVDQSGGSA